MFLASPIWLFALAAISIPVVIHLWNIKPGKTLKVGSISLFTESSPKSSRSFKLLDLLLLLLRCLLLVLLAVLLATPFWQQQLKAGKAKGWILIPRENFNAVYQHFKTDINTLNKAGYELHFFNKNFAKANLQLLLQHPGKDTALAQPANYWVLIKQLAHQLPASVNAELFTPNTITHFTGNRPATALKLNWHTYTPADSVNTWLAAAWLTANGNIRVVQGTATPSATTYHYNNIKNGGQSGSNYSVGVENGVPVVSLNQYKITVDTASLRIAVYTDKNQSDAGYLKAGLNAIAQLTQRKTIINIYNQADAVPGNQSWVFWLSEKPISPAIVQKAKNFFSYADGKVTDVNTWLTNNGNYAITQGAPKVSLYKIISTNASAGNAVWTDGFGNPILSAEQKSETTAYSFYSRFNPAWNELAWTDAFPKWLLALTYPAPATDLHDRRMISNQQLQPTHVDAAEAVASSIVNHINLTHYLWLALILAFFTERWLATKNQTALTNG